MMWKSSELAASAALVLGLALTASGCALLGGADPLAGDDGGEESTGGGEMYAGTWTRSGDEELVFEVTDDGTTVSGALTQGGDYESYTFELTRKGDKLVGESSVSFPEEPDKVWHSEWEAMKDGDQIKTKQTIYDVDPATGEEVEGTRETLEMAYAFTPAAAAAPPPAGGGFDPTTMVKAPGQVPVGPDLAVGMAVWQKMEAGGQTYEIYYAVVGEEGDSWRYECVDAGLQGMAASFPDLKDMVMGLVVNKDDGKVSRAVLGKPGEPGKEIGINPVYEAGEQPVPQGTDEDVTIGLGTFAARRYDNEWDGGFSRSWSGLSGEVEGLLLKVESSAGDYELADFPEEASVDAGYSVDVTKIRYTNGMEYWTTEDVVARSFFPYGAMPGEDAEEGSFLMKTEGSTMEITELKTDAEPLLAWE